MSFKTTFEILDILYAALNVSAVTDTISGSIFRERRPLKSENQDIIINVISNVDPGDVVQEAAVNINVYVENLISSDVVGLPDEDNMATIMTAIIARLDAYSHASEYFSYDKVYQITIPNNDNAKESIANLRLNCQIENNK